MARLSQNLLDTYRVKNVAHLMRIACIQMATPFVLDVMQGRMAITPPITINKCQMYNSKDQPEDCNQEEFQSVLVNSSKHTKMVKGSYATIISTVMARLLGQK